MLGRAILTGALLLFSAHSASATTVTYDFAGATTPYSLVKCFPGPCPSAVSVTANTVSDNTNTVTPVAGTGVGVGQWFGLGLGLKNGSGDNSHTVDGLGLNDLLQLTFDAPVKILSASFAYAGIISNSVAGFDFFADDDGNGSVAGDRVLSHQVFSTVNGFGSYDFTTDLIADIFSKNFAFAALWDQTITTTTYYQAKVWNSKKHCYEWVTKSKTETRTLFDSFKLKSITVELEPPSEVPVPAALPLLASVIGIGGLVARKRKSKP